MIGIPKHSHRTLRQIFTVPLFVGVLSAAGLISALVGDGWWDRLSWIFLSVPVLLYFFFLRLGKTC
jgi:hypothetical protein